MSIDITTNVSVTITGTYPDYVVTFSDQGTESVPQNTTKAIVYSFAQGTTGFSFVEVVDIEKDPEKSSDSISVSGSGQSLTVTASNTDVGAARIDYRIQFSDSQGRKFDSSDPAVVFEPE